MKNILACCLAVCLAFASQAISAQAAPANQPEDVAAFIKKEAACENRNAEMPDANDPALKRRSALVEKKQAKLHCETLKQELKDLRIKYKKNKNVIVTLSDPNSP